MSKIRDTIVPFTFFVPLFFVSVLLCALIVPMTDPFKASFFANVILIILLMSVGSDFLFWLLCYEISSVSVASAFTIEGRAYRRMFAFLLLSLLSCVSSSLLAVAFLGSTFVLQSTTTAVVPIAIGQFAVYAMLVKTPTYPFSFWLPEAHVEGSFFGSVLLAAFAMKFSLFGFILFCRTGFQISADFSLSLIFIILGCVLGIISVANSSDVKLLLVYQ